MPNYEYQCPQCDHRFDVRQSVGEAPPDCPQCGAATKKVFQVPRIIFKGSGFYVTDKRSESSTSKSEKAAPEAASPESKSEPAKSDEKAALQTEKAPASPTT